VRRLDRLRNLLRDVREPRSQIVPVAADEARLAATNVSERPVAVPLDLEEPTGALWHLLLERREHRGILAAALRRRGAVLALLQQEPVLGVAVELRRHERPHPVEARAAQANRQSAVLLLLDELVRAPIPDLDGSGAVLAFRDLALELRILERMVLDVDGEAPLA